MLVIDLQRVTRPLLCKSRWLKKDLGALAYSVLNAGMTKTDLLRMFKIYRQSEKCDRR